MLYLGVMHAEGRGVPQDYVRAYMWFSLSAAQGEQGAVRTLEMAAQRMTPNQVNQAQNLAHDWKPATLPTPHERSVLCGRFLNFQSDNTVRSASLSTVGH
jgi:TPR repeat protein